MDQLFIRKRVSTAFVCNSVLLSCFHVLVEFLACDCMQCNARSWWHNSFCLYVHPSVKRVVDLE